MSIHPTALPSLSQLAASTDTSPRSPIAEALSTLFEPSPVLLSKLVPALVNLLQDPATRPTPFTYLALIDLATTTIQAWPHDLQAAFVGGHPRIGEVNGLSALSAQEQLSRATPPEVLARLVALNAAYEKKYEGLRYITFVNGRSRRDVMEEMEVALGVDKNEVEPSAIGAVERGGKEWVAEVRRAVEDVGRIAKSRLGSLGVDGHAPA
ncbi:Oxo-4-hydroxy-4-carboxy-5-ureidoimidazoline decarboxylase [Amylostereum chailletii]|nr:Oxo-4-hydroxy-4-carboxy-5-ureidoimidazoline decarboxylase [Amylostereum chailletii]